MNELQGGASEGPVDQAVGAPDISLVRVGTMLVRGRRWLMGLPLVGILAGAAITAIVGTRYEAESVFAPAVEAGGRASQVAAIAARFGFGTGSLSSGRSLQFYATLARSRSVLSELALSEFEGASGKLTTLMQLEGAPEARGPDSLRQFFEYLLKQVTVSTDRDAGTVRVLTKATTPELAEAMNRRLLELIAAFNIRARQAEAGAEREFAVERLEEIRTALDSAEDALQQFQQENRQMGVPQRFEEARLQRRIQIAQQVFVSVAQAVEEARIEEARSTSVIAVVSGPESSAIRRRGLVRRGLVGFVLGGVIGLVVVFVGEFISFERRASPSDYAELQQELSHSWLRWLKVAR